MIIDIFLINQLVISVTTQYLKIKGKWVLAISRNEEETNPDEDVDEADGAADGEAYIQPGTVIEGDEHEAETLF